MTKDFNDGIWHSWGGGKCPLHASTLVDATYTSGRTYRGIKAVYLSWGSPILFKVVEEYKETLEFWIADHVLFESKEQAANWIKFSSNNKSQKPILVREVREEDT